MAGTRQHAQACCSGGGGSGSGAAALSSEEEGPCTTRAVEGEEEEGPALPLPILTTFLLPFPFPHFPRRMSSRFWGRRREKRPSRRQVHVAPDRSPLPPSPQSGRPGARGRAHPRQEWEHQKKKRRPWACDGRGPFLEGKGREGKEEKEV